MPPMLPLPDNTRNYLESLASDVHKAYFWKVPPLPVRWGQQISRKRRRSIRLGSYNHLSREIRVHPLLDSPEVPQYFVESVIFHEYLHHMLGPDHDTRFHEHEKLFRFDREARTWLKRNLHRLLGRRKPFLTPPPAERKPVLVQLRLF